jgi:hypothetical protein
MLFRLYPFEAFSTFEFKDPDTGYQYREASMQALLTHIIRYRVQNQLPLLDELGLTVENYLCSLPCHKGKCVSAPPLKRGFLAYFRGGIALIKKMIYNETVSQDEADRRGLICVTCPHNVFPDKGPFLHWSDQVAEASVGDRKSKYHERLGSCEVCSCTLKAKVFFRGDMGITAEQTAQMRKVKCWQTDEQRK